MRESWMVLWEWYELAHDALQALRPSPRICTSVYASRRAHVLLQRLCIVGWVMGFFHGILYRSYYTGFHGFFEMACGARVVATHLVRGWQLWETDNSWSVLIPYYTYRLILFYSCHILHWRWVLRLRWRFRVESVDVLCVQLLNSFTTRKIEKWLWHSTFELFAKKRFSKKTNTTEITRFRWRSVCATGRMSFWS